MKSRPTRTGSARESRAWLDTVPSAPRHSESNHPDGSRERATRSRRKRKKPVSIWHRPLGEVIGTAARKLAIGATQLAIATLAITSMTRSRTLAVIERPRRAPKKKPDSLPRSKPVTNSTPPLGAMLASLPSLASLPLAPFAKSMKSVKSAGVAAAQWLKPAPPPRKAVRRPAPSRPSEPQRAPPAFGPAPASAYMNAMPRSTRPPNTSDIEIGMFLRKLYNDGNNTLFYNPSGMGTLWTQRADGAKTTAGPEAKWYFLTVLKRFEELGETADPSNPKYVDMMKSFTYTLLTYPMTDPVWRQMVADDPRHVARCFAGLEKPQNIVEVSEASLQRIPAAASATLKSDPSVLSA